MRLSDGDADAGPAIAVLVVDPERAFAECLARCLADESTGQSVSTASSALEALHSLEQTTPDVILLGTQGGAWQHGFLRAATRQAPGVPVVALVGPHVLEQELAALVTAGVRGCISTDDSLAHVVRVVAAVSAGQWWLPRALLGGVVRTLSCAVENASLGRLDRLTFRERQVLFALTDGLPRTEIAARLHLSVNTVRTHMQHVLAKLEVHTSLEAVALAVQGSRHLDEVGPGPR